MKNKFKIGDTVTIVGNPSADDAHFITTFLGKTGKITRVDTSATDNTIYFVNSIGLYFYENELILCNELREPVTEDDILELLR